MKNLLILFIIFASFKSFSWSKDGHQIVAQIAKQYLNKPVLDSVQKYLDTLSFEEASTWMDDQRKNHEFDYLKPWHYVNIAKDATYVKTEKPNLINQLQLAIKNLKNHKKLNATEINFNLKVLFHLVGDLHQPLHCGYLEDKGGNDVELHYLKRKNNLHHVWDNDLIASNKIDSTSCLGFTRGLSDKQIQKIEKIDIMAWVNDSRFYLPFIYDIKDSTINNEYILTSNEIIILQLSNAGIRLASILNSSFSK
jgi:hypothetical protein